MKLILSALLESLKSKGLINESDAREVRDLYTLTSALEGSTSRLFNVEERAYLGRVQALLCEKDFSAIEDMVVPPTMKSFHEMLLRSMVFIRVAGAN